MTPLFTHHTEHICPRIPRGVLKDPPGLPRSTTRIPATGSRVAASAQPCPGHYPSHAPVTLPTSRTKRVAAKSIAAIPAEAIPFLGVAVLIADTGYELYAACETVRELDGLYGELGMRDDTLDDALHSVYDPELPDAGMVWDGVVARSSEWLDQAREAM